MLFYRIGNNNLTEQGNETEGFERKGSEGEGFLSGRV
jgi:hypothetical protein